MNRNLFYVVSFVMAMVLVGVTNGAEGLLGEYFEWTGSPPADPWGTPLMKRLDPVVNFNWGANAPDPAISPDGFAVRWTGEVEVPVSGTYTFYTQTDDGVRMWVNKTQIINNWTDHGSTRDTGQIQLNTGKRYEIRLEYYENGGDALCQLSWSGPGLPAQIIPSQYLWVGGARPFPRHPNPPDGAIIKDTWVTLSWSPGDFAASHSVYVGENPDEVAAGTGDTFRGTQTALSFALGFPGFPYPDGLISGTTYYWLVEDIEADGATKHKGPVWSFTVAPTTAYNPRPADGADYVDPNVVLSWQPGFGAILHTVYFGNSYDTVNNAAGGIPQGATTYKPGTLASGKVFYWRVDEFRGFETVKGAVWCFTTPGAVGNARPANGSVNVRQNQILKWTPADYAVSHEVYFGTDADAVRNAAKGSPEHKGSRALGSESYDPGKLPGNTAYCWRIDEVDAQGGVQKGPVWNFTTADFIVVDDFEDYTDNDTANETIWQAWVDGYLVPENGSLISYEMPPYAEQTVVHGGSQSMPFMYDVDGKYAEATLTLTYPRDWTEAGVDTLTVWFHGNMVNDAAKMYVSLNGAAPVYHADPAVTQIHAWTQWDIPLQTFADQGVNLADISTIAIGFGNRTSPTAGGSGIVYIDDIGLH